MSRDRYKKLYYVPGLISLFAVTLLFVTIGKEQIRKLDKRVMEVNAWHPSLEERFPFPERNYNRIILTGDGSQDVPSIESARAFIKQMYEKEDTVNGIHFIFQDSVTYGTYVGVLNSFRMDSITYFAVHDNSIWVLNRPRPKPTEDTPYLFVCGTSSLDYYYDPYDDMSLSEKIETSLSPYRLGAARLWPALTLLLLLVILSLNQALSKKTIP